MKPNRWSWGLAVFFLILSRAFWGPVAALAQETREGVNYGNYNVKQSVELGWRFAGKDGDWITGNQATYETFVNLRQGARLLDQTLEMRSLKRAGSLFDDFYLTSFGYGGDPNNLSILRVSKEKWYTFNASFRRNRNLWDYNLLANPLNPTNSNPAVAILLSPHLMRLSRRMSDFNLTLLPQSRVRFRLGYSRSRNEGPSFSSFHEGTDVLLFQDWNTSVNSYQVGVDFKVLPRTNISYDQFIQYHKGDTSWADHNQTYQLADGTPVDLGLIFNTVANQPCARPISSVTTDPPTVTPTCNGYLLYERGGRVRTKIPTEQFSFQSSSITNLDIAGRFIYSSSNSDIPVYNEFFQGRVTRTIQRQFAISGPVQAKRVSVSTDVAATYSITPKFRIVDEFRFWHWRIPGQWASAEASLFGRSMLTAPVVFDPATCPPPYTAATCPPHVASSPADISSGVSSLFLGQNIKLNTVRLEYDFTKRIGGRLGYRYRHRTIHMRDFESEDLLYFPSRARRGSCGPSDPLEADGSCHIVESAADGDQTTINEHSLLMGAWLRPVEPVRVTFDMELMSADNVFTRISPRQLQHYKMRTNYKPTRWMNLGGSMNIYEARNNVTDINHTQHNRSYGFSSAIAPDDRWSLDLGYDYNNILSHTNICYAGPALVGALGCPILAPGVASIAAISTYNATTDFAYTDIMFKPLKQVMLNLGYAMNRVSGETLILNPNTVPGPLQTSFNRPYGSVAIDIFKGWTAKAAWGFYDYHEQVYFGDPTAPRSFRGNLLTLSIRYSL